ncbi:hypothetical protein PFLmoz3_04750 [Pseudomonas fluorescens]|uniref:Uncharacterized protein n=1 Tax=Pseudomonas fluorescens TaxID=294 RepID=A0A109LDF1_PSEFL|nr:hypothetical protein PFLmoz3_04750 [Pseudomonas fluorescens]
MVIQRAGDLQLQRTTAGERATGLVVQAVSCHLQNALGGQYTFHTVIQRLGDTYLQAVATDDFTAAVIQRIGHQQE